MMLPFLNSDRFTVSREPDTKETKPSVDSRMMFWFRFTKRTITNNQSCRKERVVIEIDPLRILRDLLTAEKCESATEMQRARAATKRAAPEERNIYRQRAPQM